ncbi:uncharacterized protein LOC124155257 [Ischnura elegans]|uniref:uncharacterized protein LOC124155257 n=1 Tax=Ischnura elegans TaxID=197161 RepID=UPI001ED8A1C6|nr:uncharacterized protein LOC124155257 [Ischnura elegans]
MVLISRTGLQESEKKPIKKASLSPTESSDADSSLVLSMPPLAVPAPFTHRPLADLPNPFRRTGGACSILCNHPAPPSAVQGLLQVAKISMDKSSRECLLPLKGDRLPNGAEDEDDEEEAVVPEELFRRYTETDSRPVTPALSSSASDTYGPLSRRSQTPDPPYRPQPPQRQKTMLVLDLRRSQSQDAGIWQSQQSRGGQSASPASSESPKNTPKAGRASKFVSQASRKLQQQQQQQQQSQGAARAGKKADAEPPSKTTPTAAQAAAAAKKKAGQKQEKKGKGDAGVPEGDGGQGGQVGTMVMPPTPREEEAEERQSPTLERKGARKRPHKKKKRSIGGGGGLEAGALAAGRGETPEKEFRGMPEPRETQVSTLAGDGTSSMSMRAPSRATPDDALFAYDAKDGKLSTQPHTRPSTSQTRASPAAQYGLGSAILGGDEYDHWDEEGSFLDPSVLRHLERELDRETVETEFRPVRKRALMEALKSKWQKLHHHSRKKEKMVSMGGSHQPHGVDTRSWSLEPTNLWLNLPRTFSRQSARFELPFDSRRFRVMTPLQYVREYVILSSGRRMLYNRVFNRHRNKDKQDEEPDEDDDSGYPEERMMSINCLTGALSEVMGKELTKTQAEYFLRMCGHDAQVSSSGEQSTQVDARPQCIDFRTFSGIAAVCERLIGGCAKLTGDPDREEDDRPPGLLSPRSIDPPHQIETVDFEKLPNRLRSMPDVNPQLAEILMFIKDL